MWLHDAEKRVVNQHFRASTVASRGHYGALGTMDFDVGAPRAAFAVPCGAHGPRRGLGHCKYCCSDVATCDGRRLSWCSKGWDDKPSFRAVPYAAVASTRAASSGESPWGERRSDDRPPPPTLVTTNAQCFVFLFLGHRLAATQYTCFLPSRLALSWPTC